MWVRNPQVSASLWPCEMYTEGLRVLEWDLVFISGPWAPLHEEAALWGTWFPLLLPQSVFYTQQPAWASKTKFRWHHCPAVLAFHHNQSQTPPCSSFFSSLLLMFLAVLWAVNHLPASGFVLSVLSVQDFSPCSAQDLLLCCCSLLLWFG